MGCDIHTFTEVRVKDNWESGDYYIKNPYFGIDDEEEEFTVLELLGRNYSLFALLADVRNSTGIKPISLPKGLPSDVSSFVKSKSDWWDGDGHNHSFLNLNEIKTCTHECIKDLIQKLEFKKEYFNIYGDDSDLKIRIVFWFDN